MPKNGANQRNIASLKFYASGDKLLFDDMWDFFLTTSIA